MIVVWASKDTRHLIRKIIRWILWDVARWSLFFRFEAAHEKREFFASVDGECSLVVWCGDKRKWFDPNKTQIDLIDYQSKGTRICVAETQPNLININPNM